MDIMEHMRHRRSVRQYTGAAIDDLLLKQVLEAGIIAPTGRNLQSVECIVIKDRHRLQELAHSRKSGAGMLEKAGAAILVLADADKTDTWLEDASIAAAYMHLTADALGLGSCWIQMRARESTDERPMEDWLRERFLFPTNLRAVSIISLGVIDSHPDPHAAHAIQWKKVHTERY